MAPRQHDATMDWLDMKVSDPSSNRLVVTEAMESAA